MTLRFLTSTPLDIRGGSGTYVGIAVLARTLEALGHSVRIESPGFRLPVVALERAVFNRGLRPDSSVDLTVGFDLDGYRVAGLGAPHVAALKGVIADEARFERGPTRISMNWQARRERDHALRADRVIATSRYSAERARELYELPNLPEIVPEPIDLNVWRPGGPPRPTGGGFTVLAVGRLYRRKRVELLLEVAAALAGRIPGFELRIVGNGPCRANLLDRARELRVEKAVRWVGDVSRSALEQEYARADLFVHASVQEAFGIVLLEAMAAGRPIVAARAGAVPETAPHAILVEPESGEALAAGIEALWRDPDRRSAIAAAGLQRVQSYEASAVARQFLQTALGQRGTGAA